MFHSPEARAVHQMVRVRRKRRVNEHDVAALDETFELRRLRGRKIRRVRIVRQHPASEALKLCRGNASNAAESYDSDSEIRHPAQAGGGRIPCPGFHVSV